MSQKVFYLRAKHEQTAVILYLLKKSGQFHWTAEMHDAASAFSDDKETQWQDRHPACLPRIYGHLHSGHMEALTLGRQDACTTMKELPGVLSS